MQLPERRGLPGAGAEACGRGAEDVVPRLGRLDEPVRGTGRLGAHLPAVAAALTAASLIPAGDGR